MNEVISSKCTCDRQTDGQKWWQQEKPAFIILLVFRFHDILARVIELHGQFIKLCSCCLWRRLGNRGNWWTDWVTLTAYDTSMAEKVKDTNTSSTLHLSSLSTNSWVTTSYELLSLCVVCRSYMCARTIYTHLTERSHSINTLKLTVFNTWSASVFWCSEMYLPHQKVVLKSPLYRSMFSSDEKIYKWMHFIKTHHLHLLSSSVQAVASKVVAVLTSPEWN